MMDPVFVKAGDVRGVYRHNAFVIYLEVLAITCSSLLQVFIGGFQF